MGQGEFNSPANIAEDSAGNIYVADTLNNRFLQFKPPFANGMSASLVIGAPGLRATALLTPPRSSLGALTPLKNPVGLPFESPAACLPVTDAGNRLRSTKTAVRFHQPVLQFKPPFANGMSASLVIGQPDFVTGTPNTTQNGLGALAPLNGGPVGLAFDGSGNLWGGFWPTSATVASSNTSRRSLPT